MPLYERILARMEVGTNRFLSQVGRLTLINSVIFSMEVIWLRTFVLSTKSIQMIQSAMLRFVWHGSIHSIKLIPCSFSKLEYSKSKGGPGTKNMALYE